MKKYALLALLSVVAVSFTTTGCGGCTSETHTVTIRERYVPVQKTVKRPTNPEAFEPVERF